MRTTSILGAILCLSLATACDPAPQRVGGAAGPAGATTSALPSPPPSALPTPSATASTTTPSTPTPSPPRSTSASPSPSKSSTPLVLGPKGFGALRLGMTAKQAEATGLIVPFTDELTDGCSGYTHLRASETAYVDYSGSTGIEVIVAYPGVRTPEGIKLGSSLAAVRAAYPDWYVRDSTTDEKVYTDGIGFADVPGNSSAVYRIDVTGKKVKEITLQLKEQNCYE